MITSAEAKAKILANPTFERKVELYNQVAKIIDQAVEAREKSFRVTEEQHLAVGAELRSKGYSTSQNLIVNGINFGINIGGVTLGTLGADGHANLAYTHTYYMN